MQIPRLHEFRTDESADALFRKLPAEGRFWFPAAAHRPDTFGAEPVAVGTAHRRELPGAFHALRDRLPRVPDTGRRHFFGGALVALTYEAGDAFEGTPLRETGPGDIPDLSFALHDTAASVRDGRVEIVSWGLTRDGAFDERLALRRARALEERLRGHGAGTPGDDPTPRGGDERSSLTEAAHASGVGHILRAIRRGDIYQGNLTARIDTPFDGDAARLFALLRERNAAPHAAFWEAPAFTVVSSSPERLLAVHGRRAESRPIKGTAPRSRDPEADRRRAEALLASPKDHAELLMITDLVRNDLGKVCRYGTIVVPELAALESFPHVHHLVATVTGELRPREDAFSALAAMFPYGSITGAPKRRAMEILRALEPQPRGLYTGTVGWVGFDGGADFNVAIRSGHLRDGVFSHGAGGGIVADSDPEAEWRELETKLTGLRDALRGSAGPAPAVPVSR